MKSTMSGEILGVVMDSGLRLQQRTARAGTNGLAAAMALKRLRPLSSSPARRLFEATVAPVVDYAACVWMHPCKHRKPAVVHRVQKIGAQAITGCLRTASTAIAESEASICIVQRVTQPKQPAYGSA